MTRRTALNPDGTGFLYGANVRVERGLPIGQDGHAVRDGQPHWIIYHKVDVSDDPDTTYTYRFEEAGRFPETELGELPSEAEALAIKLADGGK